MNTEYIKFNGSSPDRSIISHAGSAIAQGRLVVFPTETVYGIAANALLPAAVERLYELKGRPREKPFSILIADRSDLDRYDLLLSERTASLMETCWPGPLTIIMPERGEKKIGIRMTSHGIAQELLRASKVPVVAPSANLSGKASPVDEKGLMVEFNGKVDMILDTGKTEWGIDSTVIDMTTSVPRIVRTGAISPEEIRGILKTDVAIVDP